MGERSWIEGFVERHYGLMQLIFGIVETYLLLAILYKHG